MKHFGKRGSAWTLMLAAFAAAPLAAAEPVRTSAGLVEGKAEGDGALRAFLGIPYAAPPVGDLRWREPQPVAAWQGVRQATAFGARCMQGPIFDDMVFRDAVSEDCLYLNVWTPARKHGERLPVMVWIYGGGFQAGSASEPRQDGARLARKGVVLVSMNYRLGVFGFFAHPELTAESGRRGLGQLRLAGSARRAALGARQRRCVRRRPGQRHDLRRVCGLLLGQRARRVPARPRASFQRAIGESGAYVGRHALPPATLAASEKSGAAFAARPGRPSLAALRRKPAQRAARRGAQGAALVRAHRRRIRAAEGTRRHLRRPAGRTPSRCSPAGTRTRCVPGWCSARGVRRRRASPSRPARDSAPRLTPC